MMTYRQFLLVLLVGSASAFSVGTPGASNLVTKPVTSSLSMSAAEETETTSTTTNVSVDPTDSLMVPFTFDEMVRQASSAMTDAYKAGKTRQMLRVLLPRDPGSESLGQMVEMDADMDTRDLILAPPDETWQGGIMQLYRACIPTVQKLLREFSSKMSDNGGVVPRIVEDRSVDDSGVDGIGLWMTQGTTPADDVSCFVQPSQETIEGIESISNQAGSRLVALLNPQWRNVDDALDAASREDSLFGNFASFLGGKGNSLKRLDELGYENVYTLEGYVCKGGNVRLIKRFDSDWGVFAENDASTNYIKCGTSPTRPTYQDVDKMLDDMGISLKYARDIGMAPKF